MSTIVLATGNVDKVAEIKPMLLAHGIEVKLQSDFFAEEVVEDGLSFIENAIKKARYASQRTGLSALADDSGLEVNALQGEPGIYSARYAGENGLNDSKKNLQQVLYKLGDLPYEKRQARYSCVCVYVKNAEDPMPLIGVGHWYGEILKQPRTNSGIGYDDIMWIPKLVKTVSEIPFDVKNRISHRAQAVNSVLQQLKNNQ
jgi:XTP/dITP diphosphohydrolase